MRRRHIRKLRKVAYSLVVLVAAFAMVEGGARAWLGEPPPYDQLARISKCRVQRAGNADVMDCQPGEGSDVAIPRAAGRPRVVFLGGSSVRQAELRPIPRSFPDAVAARIPEIEVINLGVPGLAAAGVARLAEDLTLLKPALIVIYSGHNDYNQDVFRGSVAGTYLWMTPIYQLLSRSWLHGLLARQPRGTPFSARPTGYVNPVTDDLALRVRAAVDTRYRHDLAMAVEVAPAPVLLCTLLRNPDYPPTGVLVTGKASCAEHLPAITGDAEPHHRQQEAARWCGGTAIEAWTRFQAERASGDAEAAKRDWYRSLDIDALPLRAPSSADPIIRQVASETGATLSDLEARWGPNAPAAWFRDNLHFSEEGADAVGEALVPTIRASLAL